MRTKDLLLKLRLCHGIGVHGETQVYQWLKRNHELERTRLSVKQLAKIASVVGKWRWVFKRDYFSKSLKRRIRLNRAEKYITILDPEYPDQLREAWLPPNVLFYRGNVDLLKGNLLGVVGARRHSGYANQAVNLVLPPVVRKKVTVVAGLADGVDSLGHLCAINNQGSTVAVIGTGLNRVYPRDHVRLQRFISRHQLLITEYPLDSGPRKFHFVNRNRIIAGLVETIVIIEARRRSGSLITASYALQDNRNVTAVPGRIDSPLSVGTNELIAAGAKPVRCAEDVLSEFRNLTN